MNPTLVIDKQKFKNNLFRLADRLRQLPLRMHFDTTAIDAYEPLVAFMAENGFPYFSDSCLNNFFILKRYARDGMLTRPPALSEVNRVVDLCDLSYNSEWEVICALSDAALVRQTKHRIILLLDLGDLNSGLELEEAVALVQDILNLRGVELVGLATKFMAYGQVVPEISSLETLAEFAQYIEERYGFGLSYINAGNSSTLHLLGQEDFPAKINHLNISETVLTGRESAYDGAFAGLHQDICSFQAEINELKRKPSLPRGKMSGRPLTEPLPEDRGLIYRINLALSHEQLPASYLQPQLKGLRYLGQTTSESIYDISQVSKNLNVGDSLDFYISYPGICQAFQSHHIDKILL